MFSYFAITLVSFVAAVHGTAHDASSAQIRLQDVKEFCAAPFITRNFDPEWEHKQGVFYNNSKFYPILSSKSELIRFTQALYKSNDFEDLRESHLINSCIRVSGEMDEEGRSIATFKGYNDQTYVKVLTPIKKAPYSWTFPPAFVGHPGAKMYISLSDNKSFNVIVLCFDDNAGTYTVVSPFKSISREGINLAKEHLKALGFKEEYMVELDHEKCGAPITDLPRLPRQGRSLQQRAPPTGNDDPTCQE